MEFKLREWKDTDLPSIGIFLQSDIHFEARLQKALYKNGELVDEMIYATFRKDV